MLGDDEANSAIRFWWNVFLAAILIVAIYFVMLLQGI